MTKPIQTVPNFMFREEEIKRLLRVLSRGQSVLLVGIRRTGKTQLMKATLQRQTSVSDVAYLDVQDCVNLYDFYSMLLQQLPKPVLQQLSALLEAARNVPDGIMQWIRRHVDKV